MKLPTKPKPKPKPKPTPPQTTLAFAGGLADRLPTAPPVEGEVAAVRPPLPPPPRPTPAFRGGLADRQPGAPPVAGDVVAGATPQPPAAAAQDPMSWMQAVFANPPGGANENVGLALQDQAIRSRTAPWMGRDQLAKLLAATKGA